MSLSAPNRWSILVIVCVAQFMVVLDATIVNVALPSIQHGLHFSPIEPAVDRQRLHARLRRLPAARRPRVRPLRPPAPVHGRARRLHGRLAPERRRDLVRHARSAAAPCRASALRSSRPPRSSIVTTTFAEGKERTKALGDLERDRRRRRRRRPAARRPAHRHALVALGLLHQPADRHRRVRPRAAVRSRTRAREERPETVDVAGAITVTGGLLVLVYDIVKAQQYGWTSGRTLGLFAVAAALLAAFVVDRAALARRR